MGNFNYTGTIRNIVFTSVRGDVVRVRFTNTFGDQPLQVDDAHIGVSGTDGTIQGPNVPVTFSGAQSITIPQGAEALSDPVRLSVPALADLAVSVYIPHPSEQTGHLGAQQTTYITYGTDQAGDPSTAGWFPNPSLWFVDSVDVVATHHVKGTVVALGDSITDGAASTVNANTRWPNDLARRLDARHGPTLSVADEGIGGNQVLQPGAGVAALARFDRDVIDRAGVKDVILLEGINDIGINDAQPAALIAGYEQIIAQAHAAGLTIFGGTLTPFKGAGYWSPEKEQTREAVNNWILTSGAFDGVIDFASATPDPSDPQMLNPAYDSGDHLHPNDAGYQAMANAIDLDMLVDQHQHQD
jgi:lysophospholipase L1-like esterase